MSSTLKELETVEKLDVSEQWIRWSRDMKEKLAIQGYGRFLPGGPQAIAPLQRDGEPADFFVARLDRLVVGWLVGFIVGTVPY